MFFILRLIWIHYRYKEDGYNKGEPEFIPPSPVRLQWDLTPNCIAAIEESNQVIIIKLKLKNYFSLFEILIYIWYNITRDM